MRGLAATVILILLSLFVTAYTWYVDPQFAASFLEFSSDNLSNGKIWTLVTSLFVHGNPTHLLGNMVFLFTFGRAVEAEDHQTRTIVAFLIGGVISFLLSVPFFPHDTILIGASAAIFTLAAAAMLIKPLRFAWLMLMPVGLIAIVYFLFNVYMVQIGAQSNVAYISHVIGFVIGIPLGIKWSQQWKKNLLITIIMLVIFAAILAILQLLLPELPLPTRPF